MVVTKPVRVSIFETRGGAIINEIDPSDLSWSAVANEAETVKVEIDLISSAESDRNWKSLAAPWKHSVAVEVGGRVYGGPILPHDFDDDGATLNFTARGFRVMLAKRNILPLAALTQSLILDDGLPDTSLDTVLTGFDLGTIGKKLVQQACTWPGWTDIPIAFPADRLGTRERTYPAVERKKVDAALSDLSGVENGPDFRFQLERVDADSFRWVFESGTEMQPRLQSPDVFAWEVGQGSGLAVDTDPSRMGSLAWSEGGRADDTTIIRSLYDPTLIDHGFPLLEIETDASSNTVEESTLDAWNAETLRTAGKPWEFWSFKIRADRAPLPGEYNLGDLSDVTITKDATIAGGYVGPGTYPRRMVGFSGDLSEWITVTCGEVYGG